MRVRPWGNSGGREKRTSSSSTSAKANEGKEPWYNGNGSPGQEI